MRYLFEKQESLNNPVDSFLYDASEREFPVKLHWHFYAEFIFALKGTLDVNADGVLYKLKEGEMIVLYPSSVHSISSSDKTPPVFAGLKLDLNKYPGSRFYAPSTADIFKYAKANHMPIVFGKKDAEQIHCEEIFRHCIDEMEHYYYGTDVMLKAEVYRLIFGIVRKWIDAGLNMSDCPIPPRDSYGIENISEYIDMHLHENIKVRDIAEKCHISYSGFASKFREHYGMSCKDYIERMRLYKAEEYLLYTDMVVGEISQKTGFSDSSHFIRSFKNYKGLTPKQFRVQRKR